MVFSLVDEEYLDANGNILWDKFTLFGQNKRAWKPFIDFQAPKVQGMRESNSHQRFWRPLSYHLTNPLQSILYILSKLHTCWHFLEIHSSCDSWSSPHPISNSQLHALLHFHLCPIYLVVFKGVYFLTNGISHLKGGFTLRCLQRLSLPGLATRP